MSAGRTLAAGAVAAAGGAAARRALDAALGTRAAWVRTNHRGEPVSLLAGPGLAAGLLAGAVVARPGRLAVAGAVAVTGAAVLGVVDDLTEDTSRRRKGLRGHLGALAHGELTTGALKIAGIGASGLVAAAVLGGGRGASGVGSGAPGTAAGTAGRLVDVVASGALVAATANLLNLLDLRPGRALKAAGLVALPLLATPGAPAAAACLGAAAAALPADLAERDMLGDGGANAPGALLGVAAVAGLPRPARWAVLAGAVALTAASERVSFTAVIARTPVLRELDAWGRRG